MNIKQAIKEYKNYEKNIETRKEILLDFIREYTTNKGQSEASIILRIKQPSLSKILNNKRNVSEKLLIGIVKKILERGEKA